MPPPEHQHDDDLEESSGDDSLLRRIARAPSVGAHPDLLVGTVVAGRFQVEALAGQGGMGAVYRCTDISTGQTVALKVLVRDDAGEAMDRFAREADILSTLHHASIVRYLTHGQTAHGEPYLAMEWLEGQTLSGRLTAGPLAVDDCLTVGTRLAEALGAAHDRDILHRDVKPHNVFLLGGRVQDLKLLDFGLAKPTFDAQRMTRTGTSVGTPAYMSPEQARGASGISVRADIFGLGATLFECLAGRPPFLAKDVATLLGKVLFEEVPRIRTLREDVPDHVDQLLHRMLAKDPALRPDHHEVSRALGHRP